MARSREQLIAEYLPPEQSLHEELAMLAQHPAARQKVMELRLRVIDRFLRGGSRTSDVDAAATEIGVARRQFYSLVAKLRQLGPVRALTPKFRNVKKPAPSRDGLAELAEAVIQNALKRQPDAKIASIQSLVVDQCNERGIAAPSASAIRRRVHALRRSGPIAENPGPLGERLAIDQLALDLPISTEMGNRLCIFTVVVDQNSKAILGHSLLVRDGHGWGLRDALEEFGRKVAFLAERAEEVAPRLKELTWIVPPGIENLVSILATETERPLGLKLKVIGSGTRRHGDAILRLLGDRLGVTPFRRLPELRSAVPVPSPGIAMPDAQRIVSLSVDQWNSKLLGKAESTSRPSVERRRLTHIVDDLQHLFAPVFSAVETRFAPTAPHELGF